jgi:hypothetical protein
MAVMNVTVLTIKPGRMEDYLASCDRSDAMLEKAGAKNLRLMATLTAGPESGVVISTWEADTFTDLGQVTDTFFANGGAELMAETGAEDSPIASWANSIVVDIPR